MQKKARYAVFHLPFDEVVEGEIIDLASPKRSDERRDDAVQKWCAHDIAPCLEGMPGRVVALESFNKVRKIAPSSV